MKKKILISETCQSKKKTIKRIKVKFDRKKKLKQDEIVKTKIKQFRKWSQSKQILIKRIWMNFERLKKLNGVKLKRNNIFIYYSK